MRKAHDPTDPERHKKFQFGKNPMQETPFEAKLLMQEKRDRAKVKMKQVLGMQGVDGGKCWDRELDSNEYF